MPLSHSELAPSGAARWVRCPGSIRLCSQIPKELRAEKDIEQAEIGTAAHELAQDWRTREKKQGDIASNGIVMDSEMFDAVDVWFDHIAAIPGAELGHNEHRVDCTRIHSQCFGTPDFWSYDGATIYIRDYKHGMCPVDVVDNWQLVIYAAGIWEKVGKPASVRFSLGIVQPRAFHHNGTIRVWSPSIFELSDLWDLASTSAAEALGENPRCVPGAHCTGCLGRLHCEAHNKWCGSLCDYASTSVPHDLPPAQAAVEWVFLTRAQKALKSRVEILETQIKHHAMSGVSMPAITARRGSGRTIWTLPADQVAAIGDLLRVDLRKPQQVITPKQALNAGVKPEHIKGLTTTPETGLTIKEADTTEARLIFGGTHD